MLRLHHRDDVQLSAFVLPLICNPLQSQAIVHTSVTHAHLKGLKLADYSTGGDDIMVDVLVGSDQYLTIRPAAHKGYRSIAHEALLSTCGPLGRRV